MKGKSYKTKIGKGELELEIKNLAERANGEVLARYGQTEVLATCVMGKKRPELGFFPLTVNYEERYYAAGKILGPRYIKREGKPSDNAVVTARLIDRAIRPLFNEDFKREVQVIITCLSWDEKNDPDILGLIAASLALAISDIPWKGPIGAVRIGEKNGDFILNPSYKIREGSNFEIIFAGLREKNNVLINMIEGGAKEVKEDQLLKAFDMAKDKIGKLIDFQKRIQKEIGEEKIEVEKPEEPEVKKKVNEFLGKKIEKILFGKKGRQTKREGFEKAEKLNELKEELIELVKQKYPEKKAFAKDLFEKRVKKIIHQKILKQKRRVDGRKLNEMREISCKTGLVSRTHGSGLFCRGITKSLSILTLGSPSDRQLIEGMEITGKKRFLHHYNFPPYSAGEVKPLRAPTRREIGHGMLAERALFPLIPDFKSFPYTIRIVSEILSSNGSTSMASVCSSSLALMDAGIPIKRPAAGIAIGLIKNQGPKSKDKKYRLLTDIQGPEDFHGDMDFKIAGTRKGITALQMDVKTEGIDKEILKGALKRGKGARLKILDLMEKEISKPRSRLSPLAPKVLSLKIDPEKIGLVIGARGGTIKEIERESGTTIDIQQSGLIFITAKTEEEAKKALVKIKNITREIRVGDSFRGRVLKISRSGAIVTLEPGVLGLLPKRYFGKKRIKRGDKISVQVREIDKRGRIKLILAKRR